MRKISPNDLRHVFRNNISLQDFKDFILNINMPRITHKTRTKHLNRKTMKDIDNFLGGINGKSLASEKLVYDDNIKEAFHRKFRKENAREFNIYARYFTSNQFKELLERLLFGLLNLSKLGDFWVIEYHVENKIEPQYQVLSPMNKDQLESYVINYLQNEQDVFDGSYNFFNAIPVISKV
ncbi:MAG: hypothetical protein Ta2E_01170 [Mycoplasmoidaceae bacterium]|nr:MAG: hypothetical protein Ta2E_01170 [Mycoplasmoidaceae bacterium]